ncbi:DUF397 domain-containing protein [Streptomyces sp. AK02-01A]|uniref:DUF397 domain-containing protein n=1 Tax=Streptomyces sp. AK02-01A TaxID=3028648 RepID=UPI0029B391AC|nr:DUF397 domain-containing protein [Streptomyces sp. AK02-01A]MDX3855775.1 DUF397 domain-containing protein [Streptomyces sp. AK02-01A]
MTKIPNAPAASELTAAGAVWFKSSYSDGAGNNCVEIADLSRTSFASIAIRDSKNPEGPALLVTARSFTGLINSVS